MTIKEFAYSAQQHLQASTGVPFKRAHIYELLAALFGFNSYAALVADAVFAEQRSANLRSLPKGSTVQQRCVELGYQFDVATAVSLDLPAFVDEHQVGVISIEELVDELLDEDAIDDIWSNPSDFGFPILLEGLEGAADKGKASAHYALALIHAPNEEQGVGSEYWYSQAQMGRVLTGVEKEWADAHAACLAKAAKYSQHLHEAARLGHQDALLELADRFDDPAFFEQSNDQVSADPALVAEIAERLGRPEDARKWLTAAAEAGDTEAMRQLIEDYDHGDLQRCWTWVYLAELVGADLMSDEYYAINEDGSPYDDEVGGPAFADGRDGVTIDPIGAEQDAAARRAAQEMFDRIELGDEMTPLG
jgi:TPR repeat protein